MRKIVTIIATFVSLGAIAVAASTGAEARFGASAIGEAVAGVSSAQLAQYYYPDGYRAYGRYYGGPRYYGGYSDYRTFGYPGSREALDTCAYC